MGHSISTRSIRWRRLWLSGDPKRSPIRRINGCVSLSPRSPDVEVSGPRIVKVGTPAEFQVQVTFQGKPYPAEDLEFVRYMLFDSRGELIELANPEFVGDGMWRIVLNPKQMARLSSGSNRLELAVTSRLVALPSFKTFRFVTVRARSRLGVM